MTVEFLQQSHQLNLDFSPRDGIQLLRYAMKRLSQDPEHPISKGQGVGARRLENCLGEDALGSSETWLRGRKRTLGGDAVPLGLGDFFFSPDDPLHPDRDREDEDDDEFET